MRQKFKGYLYGFLAIVVLWYFASLLSDNPIIPSPTAVFINIVRIMRTRMGAHVLYSLWRIFGGITISILIGVPIGYLMGYSVKVDKILVPVVYFTYPVPKIALLPVIMLLFGLGEWSKLIMIALIIVFHVIITSRDAVRSIPVEAYYSLHSLGATRVQIFKEIVVPASLPDVLTATRLALGTALSILFFTETFGTDYGMGYFIMDSWMRVNYLDMYSGIVVLSIMGICIFTLIDIAENYLCSWK